MRISKGNMYGFVTHTINQIKGICENDCGYCYMKMFPQKPLRLVNKELEVNLGQDNFIFIGSGTDVFSDNVPSEWIDKVLNHCKKYPKNKYLFQSKNPKRFIEFITKFPKSTVLCTTIESNRDYPNISKAPTVLERAFFIDHVKRRFNFPNMITIEPILKFDLKDFVLLLNLIMPVFVNIGADSKGHDLPEPSWDKTHLLIKELKKFTKVTQKSNLERLK